MARSALRPSGAADRRSARSRRDRIAHAVGVERSELVPHRRCRRFLNNFSFSLFSFIFIRVFSFIFIRVFSFIFIRVFSFIFIQSVFIFFVFIYFYSKCFNFLYLVFICQSEFL